MMLPNMPFRKADAYPLRLNTRCKDLTLVPSTYITLYNYNFNVVQEPASSQGQQNLRHRRIGRLHPSEETSRIRIAFGQ